MTDTDSGDPDAPIDPAAPEFEPADDDAFTGEAGTKMAESEAEQANEDDHAEDTPDVPEDPGTPDPDPDGPPDAGGDAAPDAA